MLIIKLEITKKNPMKITNEAISSKLTCFALEVLQKLKSLSARTEIFSEPVRHNHSRDIINVLLTSSSRSLRMGY